MSPVDPGAGRAEVLDQLEREVGVMVRRIRRVLAERARTVDPDLQSPSYLMLTWVDQHGPLRASELSEAFNIDKGAVSRQVQHLLELGLVDREPDPDDGRATLISMTDVGRRRLAAVSATSREWLDSKLGDLPEEDLRQFVTLLGRYNATLDA